MGLCRDTLFDCGLKVLEGASEVSDIVERFLGNGLGNGLGFSAILSEHDDARFKANRIFDDTNSKSDSDFPEWGSSSPT